MNIEVTKETFQSLFNITHITKQEKKETHEKTFYYNPKFEQRGFVIYNYVSSKYGNFYLIDINA